MPNMVLHRSYVMRTKKGRSIRFVKDTPVLVPKELVPDAVAIGAVPEKGDQPDVIGDPDAPVVLSPGERDAKILDAIKVMIERNERGDFTGSGQPDARRMAPLTGFTVDSNERDRIWRAYRETLATDDSEDVLS